jgi:hypothetical protein
MGRKRTSNNHRVSGVIIIILIALIFFAPSYGWAIRQFLSPARSANSGASHADDQNVAAQNDVLKAQLAQLQVVQAQLPTFLPNEIRAMVYSRYPLNFKNELLVSAGATEGVASGTAVVFQGILIGQVKQVFPNSAVVQTIFDNTLKMPVRVGSKGYDGLLQGGSNPMIASITKDAAVQAGDIVYTAAPGIPYGIPIATIAATSTSGDNLFQQGSLKFSYDINDVETVFVSK